MHLAHSVYWLLVVWLFLKFPFSFHVSGTRHLYMLHCVLACVCLPVPYATVPFIVSQSLSRKSQLSSSSSSSIAISMWSDTSHESHSVTLQVCQMFPPNAEQRQRTHRGTLPVMACAVEPLWADEPTDLVALANVV